MISVLCVQLPAQTTCTGLCQQQVSCPAGKTTSLSGTVYAPNGTDPLPNVTVYIPNAPVDAFPAGVELPHSWHHSLRLSTGGHVDRS